MEMTDLIISAFQIDIAHHVEVVVIDVNDFLDFLVHKRVWEGPADNSSLGEVNLAAVMRVVQLSRTDQRHDARRINIVGDLLFDDANVVALRLVQEREASLDRSSSLQGPPYFVVRRRIQRDGRTARRKRTQDRYASIALMHVKTIFE